MLIDVDAKDFFVAMDPPPSRLRLTGVSGDALVPLETAPCPWCPDGTDNRATYRVRADALMKFLAANGPPVQECFPELDVRDQERLITGICPACWARLGPEDRDEGGPDDAT